MNSVVFTQDVTLLDVIIRLTAGIGGIIVLGFLIIDVFRDNKPPKDDSTFDDDYLEDEI